MGYDIDEDTVNIAHEIQMRFHLYQHAYICYINMQNTIESQSMAVSERAMGRLWCVSLI